MKHTTLKALIKEEVHKAIAEETLKESNAEYNLMILSLGITAFSPLIASGILNFKDAIASVKSKFDQWKRNKQVEKIAIRLQGDPEIQKFLSLSKNQQKGKWRQLILSKLTDAEQKYLYSITKSKIHNPNANL